MDLTEADSRSWPKAESPPLSSTDGARDSQDDYDFPPTLHPGRELFTASVVLLAILGLFAWGVVKLISMF